jgi:glyoxylase-like metal-dependent hydrolase (beta-lactamase superfamily II)
MWAGPVDRWPAALERLLDTGAETFVPGHGPLCGRAEIERLARGRRTRARPRRRDRRPGVLGVEQPERAVINVRTIDAHRRGVAQPPAARDFVDAFARMALLARDRAAVRR